MTAATHDVWEGSHFHQIGNFFLLGHHVFVVLGAAAWIVAPSSSIGAVFSPPWAGVLSLCLGFFASIAFVARVRRSWHLEAIGTAVTAAVLTLWGGTIIYATSMDGWGGLQTGIILTAGGLYRAGWIWVTFAWLNREESEAAHLAEAVAAELRRRAGEDEPS